MRNINQKVNSKIRITFRLNESIQNLFDTESIKIKSTKSKLVNSYIELFNLDELGNSLAKVDQTLKKQTKIYTCFIKKENYQKLDKICKKFSISLTYLITHILKTNLSNPNKASNLADLESQDELNSYWQKGELKSILQILDKDIEKLSLQEALLLARTCIECGLLEKAEELLKYCKTSASTNIDKAKILSMYADITTYRSDLGKSKIYLYRALELLKNFVGLNTYNYSLGRIYSQLAELDLITENYQSMCKLIDIAFKYFDPKKDYIEIAELYLMYSNLESNNLNILKNLDYINKAENLIDKSQNIYYKGWLLNEMAMSYANMGDYPSALKFIDESKTFHKRSGSLTKQFYSNSIKSYILGSIQSSYDQQHREITAALQVKQKLKFSSPFSNFDFTILLYQAKYSYFRSRHIFSEKLNTSRRTAPYIKFLQHATDYIYSNNNEITSNARTDMKQLMDSLKDDPSLAKSINYTLETGRFVYSR